jgi:nucleoside-diphosphate-sugar epimerase
MTRHVLVAGGDGFIGNHLVRALRSAGAEVTIVDDHSTSRPSFDPNVRIIERDVSALDVSELPGVNAIVHLASPAAPHLFEAEALAVISANTLGTQRLLSLAERDGCRLLFASSSEVYGQSGSGSALREDQPTTHGMLTGRSVYGAAKRLGEELVLAARKRGIDGVSVRLFNVYGPGMDPTMGTYARVIPNFVRAALMGRPLPMEGDGSQVRSFTWIDDVVDGFLRLLDFPTSLPAALNLGRDEAISILELAQLVEDAVGKKLEREWRPRVPDDPNWRRPDASLLSKLVEWTPRVGLREGLTRLVAHEAAREVERSAACR